MNERGKPEWAILLGEWRKASFRSAAAAAAKLGVGHSTFRSAEAGYDKPSVITALRAQKDDHRALAIVQSYDDFKLAFGPKPSDIPVADQLTISTQLLQGLAEGGVRRFYPSRKYYGALRDGRASISEYVGLASESVEMISLSLATGFELEDILDCFEDMINRRTPVSVRVSLLDPDLDYLAKAIAPVLNSTADTLRSRVADTIDSLRTFKTERLAAARRNKFEVWAHNCVPNASAIILDGDADSGLIQLETKGYKTGMGRSFGFEVGAPSEFFSTLRDSYRALIRDGRRVL